MTANSQVRRAQPVDDNRVISARLWDNILVASGPESAGTDRGLPISTVRSDRR